MAPAVDKTSEAISEAEWEKINRWLTSIHRGSGHSSKAPLLLALPTQPPVSLSAIPAKWKHVQADQFEWKHPTTGGKIKGSIIIDENCKVRVGKILFHLKAREHRNPVWPELKTFYEERWLPYFGKPQRMKVDPEGAWMDTRAAEYFEKDAVNLESVPGQAHWNISIVEEAIQATKATMEALVKEDPQMTAEEAFARAIAAGNSREDVRGHSPLQHALGWAPDLDGHFYEPDFDDLPYVDAQRVDQTFGENYDRMMNAEINYLRHTYQRRLSRAVNSKNQPLKSVVPGMWVRYFRKEKKEVKGHFKGLARVLAVETARPASHDGSATEVQPELHPGRAGSVVWLVRAGRLIKADLCQLRAASEREEAYAEMMAGTQTPWTTTPIQSRLIQGQYLDFSGTNPTADDLETARWEGEVPPPKKPRTDDGPMAVDGAEARADPGTAPGPGSPQLAGTRARLGPRKYASKQKPRRNGSLAVLEPDLEISNSSSQMAADGDWCTTSNSVAPGNGSP